MQITPEQLPDNFGPQEDIERISPLRKLREAAGLTPAELAMQLTIGKQAVSEQAIEVWERGESQPLLSIPQVQALCRALGVSLDDLAEYLALPPAG